MPGKQLVECVPNFSEGRDMHVIGRITDEIETVNGVKLLDVDPGKATNRTVVTFVGEPALVIEAAYRALAKACEEIDMSQHQGEHPRMGATDVCPLIPISGISLQETAEWAKKLGQRVGEELEIPVYLYEASASEPKRKNLATIRSGEYEGFDQKIKDPDWKPDFGPAVFNARSGCTAIGARDFLVAYNVNLNTTSVRRANSVAFDVREMGRVKRKGNPVSGEIVRDEEGNALREPGMCKAVKAIGWYIDEYSIAQISMNLTDLNQTSLHEAFEACRLSANERGMRVTGSELVGLVPLKVMLDAGRYFLQQQQRSAGIAENEIIKMAVKSLGLNDLAPFDPQKKIIEYVLGQNAEGPLVQMPLSAFAYETGSESPAPGGGSISAYVGALGVALGTMVANLSAHKRGWDDRWQEFSQWAEKGQALQRSLLQLVDADTEAFNEVMAAFRLPKASEVEKAERRKAIQAATVQAIETPLQVMQKSMESFELLKEMAVHGNPNSISDAGVGAMCARTAVLGAAMNVRINLSGLENADLRAKYLAEANSISAKAEAAEAEIRGIVEAGE